MRRWAEDVAQRRRDVVRIGYFGSYARGDWGVGSDVDLVIVLERSDHPIARRAAEWDTTGLPVPADVLVYTMAEWSALGVRRRLSDVLTQETVWVFERPAAPESGGHETPESGA